MTETYGYDKTPTPPRDYDASKVPPEIKKRATWVKTKFTGEDVAEAYAQGMEIAGLIANEALEAQAYDGNSLADVTLAKDGLPTLDARIRRDVNNLENKKADKSEVTAQLAQTETKINLLIKMKANPLFHGAKGDGITDDTLAIQNAINSMPSGGILEIPNQDFLIKGSGPQLILIEAPIEIKGQGAYSRLRVAGDVPNTTDIIRISPKIALNKDLGSMENLQIMPVSGRPGRHAVHFDVSATSQYLARYLMYRNMILQFGGNAVKLTNPVNNDGLFCSEIEKNLFYGGMTFERLGDSIRILENTLAGDGIGVRFTGIHGACQVVIRDNNITTAGGAIRADTYDQVKIQNNQIEQVVPYTGSVDATIYLGEGSNGEIIGNNITGHGNVAHNIRMAKAYRTTIDKNKMRQGTAEMIRVDEQSNKTDIGYNNYYISALETEIAPSILDNGIGTMGVRRSVTPQNGFENVGGTTYNPLGIRKDATGRVDLTGTLNCGTATKSPGTTIAILPVGFRPVKSYRLNASIFDGGAKNAVLLVTASGNLQIETVSATATRLDLDGLNFQATY